MKKISFVYPIILINFLIFFLFGALVCGGCNRKKYWEYNCNWVSEEPKIIFYRGCGEGEITLNAKTYNFYTAQSNDAKKISIYYDDNKLIWEALTKLKNGVLYLEVITDNISDYNGKTIKLYKQNSQ